MKSFWLNLGVESVEKSAKFYEQIGFTVTQYGDIRSITLPEGGNLIIFQREVFASRAPFSLATDGNEVLISLNVASNEEVDELVVRVEKAGGTITGQPMDAYGYYGASFTDLDNHHFNVIVM